MTVAFSNTSRAPSPNSLDTWWAIQGEWVEEPNNRRGGCSGVQRINRDGSLLYAKKQTGHIYRSFSHPLGRPTVLRERDALLGAHKAGVTVPQIVYCQAERSTEGWRALLVTNALEGFQSLEQWYEGAQRQQYDEALHQQLLREIALNLAKLHTARWQHGCLYIKHIFVRISGEGDACKAEVALLDLEKCRRRLTSKQAALHDMLQLRRHSPWDRSDWENLITNYQLAMGRSLKRLQNATRH